MTAYDGIVNNTLNLEIVRKSITINQILELVKRYINTYDNIRFIQRNDSPKVERY
ncbi:MAG TPA: hypothetical protein VFM31_12215 [Nitrososphaeraceae archaeon]|nr:hypothetical protein [Nitrososphaeraceae archaeon]